MSYLIGAVITIVGMVLCGLWIAYSRMTKTKRHWNPFAKTRDVAHKAYLSSIPKATTEEKKNLPNIIVILMDDMGWGDIGRFGATAIKTPHIDNLAQRGATCVNGYASSPVCTPSRFGLLTGRYPYRGLINGVYFPTIKAEPADLFDMKYQNDGVLNPKATLKKGLPIWKFNKLIQKTMVTNGILSDEITIAEGLKARGYATGAFGKWHLGDHTPHLPNDKGFDYFFGAHYSNDMIPYRYFRNREPITQGVLDQTKLTSMLTQEITSFIKDHKDEPFFAYYPSPWPHHPLSAGEPFQGTSKAGIYGDCLQEVDWSVGKIVKTLQDEGIEDNTLIIFTSDNGPWHQGSPGLHRGRKGNNFDGGQAVPTICCYPGTIPPDTTITEHLMNIDFLPTAFALAGVPLPTDREIDGKDIMPLLSGNAKESPHKKLFYINGMQATGLRTRNHFKYYASQKSENSTYKMMHIHPFLFNTQDDPNESYDLRDHYPKITKELRDALEAKNCDIKKNPRGWIQPDIQKP